MLSRRQDGRFPELLGSQPQAEIWSSVSLTSEALLSGLCPFLLGALLCSLKAGAHEGFHLILIVLRGGGQGSQEVLGFALGNPAGEVEPRQEVSGRCLGEGI